MELQRFSKAVVYFWFVTVYVIIEGGELSSNSVIISEITYLYLYILLRKIADNISKNHITK